MLVLTSASPVPLRHRTPSSRTVVAHRHRARGAQSLRERRIWEKNAPHMVAPLPFIVPTHGRGLKSTAALSMGLTLYDWLAYDRNRLDDPDKHIPAHRRLTRRGPPSSASI